MDNPVLVENQTLTNIADGIRIIGNNSNNYLPSEMKTAILAAEESILNRAATTATATGNPVSFTDGAENIPVKALTVSIEPVQEGSGDPSPDNVRPISGWTGATVKRYGTDETDRLVTLSLPFPAGAGTVYGGTLDVTTGVMTVDRTLLRASGIISIFEGFTVSEIRSIANADIERYSGIRVPDNLFMQSKCSCLPITYDDVIPRFSLGNYPTTKLYILLPAEFSTFESYKAEVLALDPVFVFPNEYTTTYQLTPQEVRTLLNENHISADTGQVTVTYRAKATGDGS